MRIEDEGRATKDKDGVKVVLAFLEGATGHDTMRGVLHGYLARDRVLRLKKIREEGAEKGNAAVDKVELLRIIRTAWTELNGCESEFVRQCEERGWKIKAEGNINLERSKSVRLLIE